MLDRRTYDGLERAETAATSWAGIMASKGKRFCDDVAREAFRLARAHGLALDGADEAERAVEALAKWIVASNAQLADVIRVFGQEEESTDG